MVLVHLSKDSPSDMGVSQIGGFGVWGLGFRVLGFGFRVSPNWGYPFGGPYNKDSNILGSILGSPYVGKLPYL